MKLFFKYLTLLLIIVQAIQGQTQEKKQVFEHLTVENGLSESVVTSIYKDNRGFMWFGTQNGLNKYDGYNFIKYFSNDTVKGSISGNYIRCIFEDKNGNLWIGTDKNGLNKYNRSLDSFEIFLKKEKDSVFSDNSVLSIMETSKGRLFIGTDQGICEFDYNLNACIRPEWGSHTLTFTELSVHCVLQQGDTLWLGTNKGLLYYLNNSDEFQQFVYDPDNESTSSNNIVHSLLLDSNGDLIVGTNEGLNLYQPEEKKFRRFYYQPGTPGNLRKSEIQNIVEDRNSNLWIGSFGGGLLKVKRSTRESTIFINDPANPSSLNNDYIYSLFYDNSGILWIGTYGGGINKIDFVKIHFNSLSGKPGQEKSLLSNEVSGLYANDSMVWIGTDNGISIYNKSDEQFSDIKHNPSEPRSISSNIVYSIIEDSEKNLWIGTSGGGLNKLSLQNRIKKNYTFDRISHSPNDPGTILSNTIYCLYEDLTGNIWVGTPDGLNLIDKNGRLLAGFTDSPDKPGSLISSEIYSITQDYKGIIWIGTYNGLNRFNKDDSTFTFIRIPELSEKGINTETIYCLHPDISGELWIGTDNAGLFRFNPDNKNLVRYTQSDGLPDNVIYSITSDIGDNLWISTNNGLARIMINEGTEDITVVRYNSENGLDVDAFNIGASAQSGDGNLYFGSYKGVTWFHPADVSGNSTVPPVYITGIDLFFNPVAISRDGSTPISSHISETKRIELTHRQNVLNFHFSALNYIEPDKNNFAFMFEGLDNDWNYVKGQREAQYLYIPPGEYVFRVKASNNDGLWNETGASLEVYIAIPFTGTVWFYLIRAIGLVIMVLILIREIMMVSVA